LYTDLQQLLCSGPYLPLGFNWMKYFENNANNIFFNIGGPGFSHK